MRLPLSRYVIALVVYSFYFPTVLLAFTNPPPATLTLTLTSTSRQIRILVTGITNPASACVVEVSEDPSYSPSVNDVNTTLFTGSNSDATRADWLGQGTSTRTIIVGTFQQPHGVTPLVAGDADIYPRVGQVSTTHYVRVTCGSDSGTGSIATKNRPIGMTYDEPMPRTAAGVYGIPTLDPTSRTQTTLDPQFGTLLRKVSITGDNAWAGVGSMEFTENGAEWPFTMNPGSTTTINDSSANAGYLSQILTTDGFTRLYWTNTAPTSGLSRFLGYINMLSGISGYPSNRYVHTLSSLSSSDPRKIYSIFLDTDTPASANAHVWVCTLPASGNSYYDQSVASDGSVNACNGSTTGTWANPTAALSLSDKLLAFDATYDKTKFNSFFYQYVVGDYILFAIGRGQQNTYSWGGAYRISTNEVVAFAPLWQRAGNAGTSNQRFCGFHTVQPIPGKAYLAYENHDLRDGSGPGSGGSNGYVTPLSGAINGVVTSLTLTSNTPVSSEADTTLYAFAAGDEIRIDGEILYLVTNTSGTTWTVTRGEAGTSAAAHSNGASVSAGCRSHAPSDFTNAAIMTWDLLADPTGSDATDTTLAAFNDGVNGHQSSSFSYKIGSGWKGCNYGSTPAPCSSTLAFSNSPAFGGVTKNYGGNAGMMHAAAPHQINAAVGQVEQGVDFIHPYQDPDAIPSAVTSVTGALFKISLPVTIDLKTLPIVGFTGGHPLLDISSATTGNVIGGSAGDNYKMCVAYKANECRTGSSVGDVYANGPAITTSSTCPVCLNSSGVDCLSPGSTDGSVCIFNGPGSGTQNLLEIGETEAYSNGKYLRALTHGLMGYKQISTFANGQTTPDGNWISFLVFDSAGAGNVWVVKRPTYPTYDSIDRNTFIQKAQTVGAVGGATEAFIRFGYDTSFNCTSRDENCVSATTNAPFFYESSDTFTAVACTSGCSINVPLLPDHIAYAQVVWRDSGHSIVATSNTFTVDESGSTPIGSGASVVIGGKVGVSGKVVVH